MLMSSNYSNMGNKNKTVIHMHKLSVRQYLFLLNTSFILKTPLIYLKCLQGTFKTISWKKTYTLLSFAAAP